MMLESALNRWTLTDPRIIADTATSTIYKAVGPSGEAVALKLLKPYGADEMRAVPLLSWYDGHGAVRVIDRADTVMVLEWLEGETLGDVVRAGRDAAATQILCDVIGKLHTARAHRPQGLTSLARHIETLFATEPQSWPVSRRCYLIDAKTRARRLLETAPESRPLHGDLHHDNVMASARGWLAIDPKGLVGDPAYEVANVFRNPIGTGSLPAAPARIRFLAERFSHAMGQCPDRILEWAAVHSVVSICWSQAAGQDVDWDEAIVPNLFAAADTARQIG